MIYDPPCEKPRTNTEKSWPYYEYYIGERDQDNRKTGHGTHHWSGAESLERYSGELLRDSLHGAGEYTYRHRGPQALALTYEGHYFNNYKFGYGTTSYCNGAVFRGLYHSNFRWGPGVESHVNVTENVGLWRGRQLMRLTWKPSTPSVSPDLMSTSVGSNIVAKHRAVLVTGTRIIGEINPALDLLKEYGAPPLAAAQNWVELYPRNCTDPKSQLYHADLFQRAYYSSKMVTLVEYVHKPEEIKEGSEGSNSGTPVECPEKYYAWNNNGMIIHMMKHSYLHDEQRKQYGISLKQILNGPRSSFKQPAQHELDCRSILLASYLGHIRNVAQFINEYDVNPNVTDMAGNSAIMYAACGNQPEVIHFLVEAGGRINDYNDACCTPLGAALLIYACAQRNIAPAKMIQAILPPPGVAVPLGTDELVFEWQINREVGSSAELLKTPSNRTIKSLPGNKGRRTSITAHRKSDSLPTKDKMPLESEKIQDKNPTNDNVKFSDDKRLYYNMINEYHIKINELFSQSGGTAPVPYFFEIPDIVNEIDLTEAEEQKKVTDKKEVIKATKVSKLSMPSSTNQDTLTDAEEMQREEQIQKIIATIERLLLSGADPRRVNCPQPALFIAIASLCPDLVQLLIKYGADVNKDIPDKLGYTLIDIAVSGPITNKNLQIIQTLLENGAKADHRLPINDSEIVYTPEQKSLGPTLLHAMLAKKNTDPEANDDIRERILELLLEHGSDPTAQYKGRSALDIAVSKSLGIFDIFIESPNTNLNAIINASNQSILVKMFYMPFCKTINIAQRLQMLTNLLLFGADPLLKCQNGDDHYDNLFVYTRKVMSDFIKTKPISPAMAGSTTKKVKSETLNKNSEKQKQSKKSNPQINTKTVAKVGNVADEANDYKQAVSLVTNCARLLIIRWLQAKLMKELIQVVDKYKHRHWNMILKEYKNGKCCGLWLNPVRCLEIWDILKTTKKRKYNDKRILKYVLCIVHYYFTQHKKILREPHISAQTKTSIELEVAYFIREHCSSIRIEKMSTRPYVTPELTKENELDKFKVCFECAIPLEDAKIPCGKCKLIHFCSFECMGINIERHNCHPCSDYLKKKYFPTPQSSETEIATAATATI